MRCVVSISSENISIHHELTLEIRLGDEIIPPEGMLYFYDWYYTRSRLVGMAITCFDDKLKDSFARVNSKSIVIDDFINIFFSDTSDYDITSFQYFDARFYHCEQSSDLLIVASLSNQMTI